MDNYNNNPLSVITDIDGQTLNIYGISLPRVLSILPLRETVLFPGVIIPVSILRPMSLKLVHEAVQKDEIIAVATQRNPNTEQPYGDDLYEEGVPARVLKVIDMPDGTCTAIIQGLEPIHLNEVHLVDGMLQASVTQRSEPMPYSADPNYGMLKIAIHDRLKEFMNLSDAYSDNEINALCSTIDDDYYVNFLCTQLHFEVQEKIELLQIDDPTERGMQLLTLISRDLQLEQLRDEIKRKTQADIDKQQRDYFLQQELHNIQEQLGATTSNDCNKLRERAETMLWPDEVKDTFFEELKKMERMNSQSPDYQTLYNYLDTMLKIPWGVYTTDDMNLAHAERVLNENHYGMKEVKERILEHLAVRKMNFGMGKSTIICLYGPPGVGKTSLCRSIASALKRKYVRASLGGLHDEAEIRGHRRTYIGAMPGRIVKSLIKAESANPVFVLDEIDKITEHTNNGDPASALLEVLDPEQNSAFHDNFLEVDLDLSKVMFIATANNVGTIPKPLLDRMELIEVNGSITEEKIEIARRHLEPQVKENCGIGNRKDIKFNKAAMEFLIESYTRESGVRGLEKELDRFYRKAVLFYARNGLFPAYKITPKNVEMILGKPKFTRDQYQGNGFAGVVTGLAWTSVGGEILFIESSLSRGKGQKLTLTGNLGDVMKESAMLALEFIKAHAETIGVDMRIFDNYNIHIHVPEGAVPKDGPSAGITMTTSLVSALTQRRVRHNIAMTGEITLRGKVLPVGGIKEKILAAKRAGITDIILCKDNRKDIEEIDEMYLQGLTFHYVDTILEVLDIALLKERVAHYIRFTFDDNQKDS